MIWPSSICTTFQMNETREYLSRGRMLGNYLRRFKGTIVNGKRFAMKPDDKKGAEWWVEEVKVAPAMEAVA
jgi:hypothetical protein